MSTPSPLPSPAAPPTGGIVAPELPASPPALRAAITAAWLRDETEHVRELLEQARLPAAEQAQAQQLAADLVKRVRARAQDQGAIEAFMRQYDLGSEEGVLLMCVAEALLRIPDQETADKLIRDKLGDADWEKHLGQSDSVLVNASTWGLMLTGKLVNLNDLTRADVPGAFKRLVGRVGEPVIRLAVRQAMRIMGHQFVMGRTIDEALSRSRKGDNADYRYSFDMLGEGALTTKDAARYLEAYRQAIHAIGRTGPFADVLAAPSISIKLSALHPRYEHAKRARVMRELAPAILELAQLAKSYGIGFTIDAEEADRLELSLDLIEATFSDASLAGWEGYGLAVQAYQKRTPYVIDFLADLARRAGRRMPVRLVKGAYWDAEIKRAQIDGHPGYPVFTRKPNTDVSYLANARRMLDHGDALYPMFATHNAQTIAAIRSIAQGRPYEHQKLHGMGDDLYAEVVPKHRLDTPCRVYAPVGSHEDLLPYLVRRLLENGANSSFVNRITDENVAIEDLVRDPVQTVSEFDSIPHPRIPLPVDLFRSQPAPIASSDRNNSMGANLANDNDLRALVERINASVKPWRAAPLVPGAVVTSTALPVTNPADRRQIVGEWQPADSAAVEKALANAVAAQPAWDRTPAASRAAILEHAAHLLEQRLPDYIALCVKEAGKTIPDGVAEVREAVDFLRYYAAQARTQFGAPEHLPGPTGESNQLQLQGRGVFVCISPWNFPLAIFLGQVSAALAAGNSVIAKPAEQTNLIGHAAVKLLHEAGIPEAVLQFLPGDGANVGAALTKDPRVAGVAFTGSTETARAINRALAGRDAGPIATLIAETGGQNAFIADSSALPEQLVKDAMGSAFTSAGQRCSAARVLFVQDDIADKVMTMLAGAMDELKIGDPGLLSTDVGPVIDADALKILDDHAVRMAKEARLIKQANAGDDTAHGTFFAPRAWELKSLDQLHKEVFGPALHVVRWKADQLDGVIDAINATGYGLTLGVHSRIDETIDRIAARVKVGNVYVNRNQIGAVVGVQPFGGQGLSGTGPKAGGPHYLPRFATEKTVTVNTTAAGGNASLLTLGD
ncbi:MULTISPECIES: bifunctional proline dehydrogenase/L-glutamate gamma-semialdehyde dehydrogenase PutA [unclassified Pseudoxanthomonas]|uniref:bifunctional proline dehydrogenase/L-glutamate gamma-semialdehyde dehydrogenase PutA n=1 Tax=unclassified Pseudoxanthomonas TaxID=2645906 RepID=UPI0008E5286C|nr:MULTISPECIES: bifunctional proline dehydrogenase/L-glutamate gamma-semialdehyde dehydrogenase PutA [unclassified Pseudoxanthomonas]PPJ41102.1 bifunctional proline dehydrogenase/L-glutamate gamma-semialdehyde dehydrogenase PutA [Pseudoxanthomonas sp. KAs_5_3]SFV31249.1 L-proline dehydrogenase /delta-1-pyrroline-5-carboxylate dehydrogenase [Pseudoxanthomonas sp. YR558]